VGVFSQPNMQRDSSIIVNIAGNTLKFPWAGGFNFTNWGMMDLDNDGFKDLVVYDKSGGKIRTFINDKQSGIVSFTHNPYYQNNWPTINSWFAMYDYNCDGKEDIFTYANGAGGILVYKNISTPSNFQFTPIGHYDAGIGTYYLVSDYTPVGVSGGPYNIPVNQVALPGVTDMDGDGDLDILVFNAQGYNIEYHQNQSKELGYNCDSLIFQVIDNCWGDINESSCTVNMFVCPYPKILNELSAQMAKTNHHAGSCIMCFDADGNSLTDILLGDVVCDSVIYMHNGGITNNSHIDSHTKLYPPGKPVAMSIFPCTYYLDLNNDARRDLVAAPAIQGSENVNNIWMYTNSNADNFPALNFVKNNFLQESMIDLGEGAYPTMFDYEGDGDLDLLVGNFGYYGTPYVSKIALFKNVGTVTTPSFSLVTADFANLSTIGILNMTPTTGDMDADGDPDLLVGDNNGRFSYFMNTAGFGNPAVFSSTPTASYGVGFLTGMHVGVRSYPQIIDLDKDGKLDIIAGNQAGKIYYYHNTGTTTAPTFSLVSTALGGVNVLQSACSNLGQAMPFVFSENGNYKMLVGSECGNIYLYDNIIGNLSGTFALISTHSFGIYEGEHTAPILYDLNGDLRLDMIVGNYSGGLSYYKGLSTNFYHIDEHTLFNELSIYPNPSSDILNIKFNSFNVVPKKLQLVDVSGRIIKEMGFKDNEMQIDLSEISNGIYFLSLQMFDAIGNIKSLSSQKIIIQHE
jgi:hypothetical protein